MVLRWKGMSAADRISMVALLVAAVSLATAVYTMFAQREQWRAASLARVEVVDGGFVQWKRVSLQVASSTRWGYDVTFEREKDGRVVTGDLLLINRLIAKDKKSGARIENTVSETVSNLTAELASKGLASDAFELRNEYQVEFDLQNMGQTPARDVQVETLAFHPLLNAWVQEEPSQPVNMAPGARIQKTFRFDTALSQHLPAKLKVKLRIRYVNADDDVMESMHPLYYESTSASWKFGE